MKGTISVEQALRKGDRMIKYPVYCISVGGVLLCFGLLIAGILLHYQLTLGSLGVAVVASFVLPYLFSYAYTAYITPRWRIWAFGNVTDVRELKVAALADKLIPEEGSWQERLEIRTHKQKAALLQLQQRYNEPYVFGDDPSVGEETELIENKSAFKYTTLVIGIALLVAGIVTVTKVESLIVTVVLVGTAIVLLAISRKIIRFETIVVLNDKGINSGDLGFVPWADIEGEKTYSTGGKGNIDYIKFQYPKGDGSISITYISTSMRQVRHLLAVYRQRYEHNKNIVKNPLP